VLLNEIVEAVDVAKSQEGQRLKHRRFDCGGMFFAHRCRQCSELFIVLPRYITGGQCPINLKLLDCVQATTACGKDRNGRTGSAERPALALRRPPSDV
jgi:hypothetical protein